MRSFAVSALRSLSGRAAALADRLSPCDDLSLESLAESAEDADRRLEALEILAEKLRVDREWISDRLAKVEGAWAELLKEQPERERAEARTRDALQGLASRLAPLEAQRVDLLSWAEKEQRLRPKDGAWPQHSAAELDQMQARAAEALRRLAGVAK